MKVFANESRPDLGIGITLTALKGAAQYIAGRIFPAAQVAEKGGIVVAAQDVVSSGATVNRAITTSLGATHNTGKDVAYACKKYEDRAIVDDADIKNFGGDDAAISSSAEVAATGVIKAVETAAAALVINATTAADAVEIDDTKPFAALATASLAVKRYGQPVLVCSESWLNKFVALPNVSDKLLRMFGDGIITSLFSQTDAALRSVGIAWGVSSIMIGDDNYWQVENYEDYAAVVALRDMGGNAMATVKREPCFGFAPTFLPDDSTLDAPFGIRTVFLSDTAANAVDATLYTDLKIINGGGSQLVKFAAVVP